MNQYKEMTDTAWNKFASYSKYQCEFAIRDIHATLAVTPNGNDYRDAYTQKLWCELDAARDRIREIDLAMERGAA
jgi:hypothetical protein